MKPATMSSSTTASQIASLLGLELHGPDLAVATPASAANAAPGTVVFMNRVDPLWIEHVNRTRVVLAIVSPECAGLLTGTYLVTERPRLAFAKVLREFFAPKPLAPRIAPTVVIHSGCRIGRNASIGDFCCIDSTVVIGDDVTIGSHAVIEGRVTIGDRCSIGAFAAIGHSGFGIEHEPDGSATRIPHLGGVRIGPDVELGAHVTVARGTLSDTVIERGVKTDDHVHIAHNVRIGEYCILTACAEISGSVEIGKNCWVGPNASINNRISVGENALISIGAVVVANVKAGVVVAGNPARVVGPRS